MAAEGRIVEFLRPAVAVALDSEPSARRFQPVEVDPPRRSQRTSSTAGRPCLVMMTRSPLRAAATSSDRRAFASRMASSMMARSRLRCRCRQRATADPSIQDHHVTTLRVADHRAARRNSERNASHADDRIPRTGPRDENSRIMQSFRYTSARGLPHSQESTRHNESGRVPWKRDMFPARRFRISHRPVAFCRKIFVLWFL